MEPNWVGAATPELTHETDGDLLAYMAMADDDPAYARASWAEFYRRHVAYLYRTCLRAYGDLLGGDAGVADLVADVLRTAYEHAHKFDPAGISDAERLRWRARAWLGWIARRLVQDLLRGRGRLPTRTLELEQWCQVPEPQQPRPTPAPAELLVRQAIMTLTEREQLVVRVTFQWYQPEREHQRLPNAIAAELAETLGTTSENLRQIRLRALRKIESYIRLHGREAQPGGLSNDR